jgi:hypothetical protein
VDLAHPHLVGHGQPRTDPQHPANGLLLRRAVDAATPRHLAGRIYRHGFDGKRRCFEIAGTGDGIGLLAWFSGALFIPSFALALGVWSNSHKLFEVLYVTMWYLMLNKVYAVDYLGANSDGNLGFFFPFSIALILAAFIGRARQLQN